MDGVTEAENPAREEVWVSMGVQRFFARQGVRGGILTRGSSLGFVVQLNELYEVKVTIGDGKAM
jgi:hypothetical protein